LATDYFELRVQDELKDLLDRATKAYEASLKIAQNKYTAGVSSEADLMQAKTQLESTQAQDIATGIMRAQLEHAIAVLIGKPPGDFSLKPAPLTVEIPPAPVGLPSTLLERRPDVASAERKMASANAQIGVAIAAFFPTISLSGSYGAESTSFGTLLNASNRVWSLGAQGAETVFEGGERIAQVRAARAAYDEQVATYRQAVLSAFENVEDELAAVAILSHQAEVEDQAVRDAREAERVITNEYTAGTVDYTTVVTAQTTTLTNEQSALSVRGSRFTASVALIQALGGGWSAADLEAPSVVHKCIGCSNAETAAKKEEASPTAKPVSE
jgi:NodT family efflux transporter outer membrane factor (OMF) lipoprotein